MKSASNFFLTSALNLVTLLELTKKARRQRKKEKLARVRMKPTMRAKKAPLVDRDFLECPHDTTMTGITVDTAHLSGEMFSLQLNISHFISRIFFGIFPNKDKNFFPIIKNCIVFKASSCLFPKQNKELR